MARPTLKDIATRAGVSISTVSYALNDQSTLPLAASTRAKIRALARELGYVPNGVARSLQARSSRTIGVLLNKPLTTPRYAAIAQGLSEGLAAQGYHPALLDGASAERCVEDARGGRLEGLVFIGHDDHEVPCALAEQVSDHHIPFVALDCGPAAAPHAWSSVDFDYRTGAEQVIAHLAATGVERIVHVRPDVRSRADRIRNETISRACAALGIAVGTISTGIDDSVLTRLDRHPEESGNYASDVRTRLDTEAALLDTRPSASAIVCSWGADVEPVYHWADRRGTGLRVAALAAGVLDPGVWRDLIYSRLPLEDAGRVCADRIVEVSTARGAPRQTLLTPTLDIGSGRH
ncbi:hypothetical protein DEJ23_06875 [Curtobacterium sp. MCSS17_008]|uniref:LacI family DNA-binding transcriptional regulator n=1 Tax=Curtobacterium sp. MCSS17_008 TaxID=2175647 RepID=UPI000DA8A820|nr:LacI family DNA-binding transcriptional regulator [Curtobacterium sp. MCSS17_008]PZF57851.1 hypothetical protein DEJ23_06875 [Curtobacterium sp. MCSS17_008]